MTSTDVATVDLDDDQWARLYRRRGGARHDTLAEDVVGAVDPPNVEMIRSTWRHMARAVGSRRGTALPAELRLIETIYRLMRSVA